jgi:hypothetical protein
MHRALEREVRRRARSLCEYCRLPQSCHRKTFHVDHIVAQQHDGPTEAENLALSCSYCNFHKGTNLSGIDPVNRQMTRLFNPRQDVWQEHFTWDGPHAVGQTAIGRATVAVLNMNSGIRVRIRRELIMAGLFPPPDERVEDVH